jgi:hypothetical protein
MNMKKNILLMALSAVLAVSCTKELPLYDTPFFSIATQDGASTAVVGSDVENVNTYYVTMSSVSRGDNAVVDFTVTPGAGLKEGVDYEIVTQGSSLTFLPGIYRMPIRVRWKEHSLDDSADNTLTISLTGGTDGFCLGMPGPDAKFSRLVITKKNLYN